MTGVSPLICRLTAPELQERRSGVLARAVQAMQEIVEREDGYAFSFAPDDGVLELLFQIVNMERQCCSFLRFALVVEPDDGPIWLEFSGPEGAKAFVADLFANV